MDRRRCAEDTDSRSDRGLGATLFDDDARRRRCASDRYAPIERGDTFLALTGDRFNGHDLRPKRCGAARCCRRRRGFARAGNRDDASSSAHARPISRWPASRRCSPDAHRDQRQHGKDDDEGLPYAALYPDRVAASPEEREQRDRRQQVLLLERGDDADRRDGRPPVSRYRDARRFRASRGRRAHQYRRSASGDHGIARPARRHEVGALCQRSATVLNAADAVSQQSAPIAGTSRSRTGLPHANPRVRRDTPRPHEGEALVGRSQVVDPQARDMRHSYEGARRSRSQRSRRYTISPMPPPQLPAHSSWASHSPGSMRDALAKLRLPEGRFEWILSHGGWLAHDLRRVQCQRKRDDGGARRFCHGRNRNVRSRCSAAWPSSAMNP